MKNALFTVFRTLVVLVLFGKVLNWIFKFSEGTNHLLNSAMFTLIGIAYLVMGWTWDNKLAKAVITGCGVFLIVTNFFNDNPILNIVGIACILIPMLIAKIYKEKAGVGLAQ